MSSGKNRSGGGFSSVELMVVIGLIMIISAMAILAFLPALQDALRAEAADHNFVLDLKQLRLVDQDTVRFVRRLQREDLVTGGGFDQERVDAASSNGLQDLVVFLNTSGRI